VTSATSPPDTTSLVLEVMAQVVDEDEMQIPLPTAIPVTDASGSVVAEDETAPVSVVGEVLGAGIENRTLGPAVPAS
jgi:uncharacterized protein (UPF0216 family)